MILWVQFLFGTIVGFSFGGIVGAILWVFGIFMAHMTLGLLREIWFMRRYRDEYMACAQAIIDKDDQQVTEVNHWTRHYYVHRDFYAQSGDHFECGYHYSIRDRKRDLDWAGSDSHYTWF